MTDNENYSDIWQTPCDAEIVDSNTTDSAQNENQYNLSTSDTTFSLQTELRTWALRQKITLSALNDLLCVLAKCGLSLSLDSRTLMQTPREVSSFLNVLPGEYFHNGILKPIERRLEFLNYNENEIQQVHFLINIDGLPISKSSTDCLWPIQIKVPELRNFIYIAGIYSGVQKPKCFNNFLAKFVEEMKEILINGIWYKNKKITAKINGFICDAPAKAEIACIKLFNAYYGCPKCIKKNLDGTCFLMKFMNL